MGLLLRGEGKEGSVSGRERRTFGLIKLRLTIAEDFILWITFDGNVVFRSCHGD